MAKPITTGVDNPAYPISKDEWNADSTFNVLYYGANTTPGTTDMTAAIQAAVDAAETAGGGTVFIPAGTYAMTTAVVLPVGLTGKLRILGEAGTILKVAKAAFTHTTASSVCQNIEIGNFDIDASGVTGRYAMIGSYHNAGFGNKTGWDGLHIHDITMTGLAVDSTTTNHVWGVGLTCYHTNNGETLTEMKHILVERVKVYGGNVGVLVTGLKGSTDIELNINIDDVTIRDCAHIMPDAPTSGWAASHFHVGAYARVGRVRVEDCYGENSGDNGIEVNNAQDCIISGCYMKDQWVGGLVIGNYRTPTDLDSQKYVLRDNTQEQTSAVSYQYHSAVICIEEGFAYGTVVVDGLNVKSWNTTGAFSFGTEDIKQLTLRDFHCDYDLDFTLTDNRYPTVISIVDSGAGGRHVIEGIHINVSGTVAGAFALGWRGIQVSGPDVNYAIQDCHLNWSASATTGTKYFVNYGAIVGSYTGVLVSRCSTLSSTDTITGMSSAGTNTRDNTHRAVDFLNSWYTAPAAGGYIGQVWCPASSAWKGFGQIQA